MGIFRTKLDFSNNRQVKQRIETITNLSGATTFGVPFSDLPTGPNLTLSSITQTFNTINSTFSGNNTTTIFTWGDANMAIAEATFSAITPSTSAITQDSGYVFVPDVSSYFNIDGNTGYTQYTGVSYDIQITDMVDLGGGNYTGDVSTTVLEYVTTNSLDFTGRTIWADVSGITRTDRLIITNNPQIGYVWTCLDSEGMGEWQYNGSSTGSTIWTAGTGANSAVLGGSDSIASGNYSVAEGYRTTASNFYSHAEGDGPIASGNASHAEGNDTIANGDASHAEGVGSQSLGDISHAEGYYSLASNFGSHAEGGSFNGVIFKSGGTASGTGSHAEGVLTVASGSSSHAEGEGSIAGGYAAHSEGMNTIASGNYSHAEGFGDSTAFTTASGVASHAEGLGTLASGNNSHSQNQWTIASGQSSHAGGRSSRVDSNYGFIHSFVSRIYSNSDYSVILGGGFNNLYDSKYSGIFVGRDNLISGGTSGNTYNMILGGNNNLINNHANSFIIGGSGNTIHFDLEDIAITNNFESIINSRDCSISASTNVEINNSVGVSIGDNILSSIRNSYAVNFNEITGNYTTGNSSGLNLIDTSIDAIINGYTTGNAIISSSDARILGTYSGGNSFNNVIIGSGKIYLGAMPGNIFENIKTTTLGCDSIFYEKSNYVFIGASSDIYSYTGGYLTVLGVKDSGIEIATFSTILGGRNHILTNVDYTSILGGSGHTVSYSDYSGIFAGIGNNMTGATKSVILGGENSLILNSDYSGIFAGLNNQIGLGEPGFNANAEAAVILGGYNNIIYEALGSSSILGGRYNEIHKYNNNTSIVGGAYNSISGNSESSGIFAGTGNTITNGSNYSSIIGGKDNLIDGHEYAAIIGGYSNTIHFDCSGTELKVGETILGGYGNTISASSLSTILGGSYNEITNYDSSGILGGSRNKLIDITDDYYIDCDFNTEANDETKYSTIIGGVDNSMIGKVSHGSILGGSGNTINGNITTGTNYDSAIIGGRRNIINELVNRSVILGGSDITATTSDMIYVPDLVIDGLISASPLETDANGKIIDGASDARLKQNVNILTNSLNTIKNLRGVSFEYTPESNMGGGVRYGFIAQEVQEHVPNIVRNRAKGDGMLSLNYNEIVPILVEAVKELSSGVTTSNNTHLETQTILAEDNNIELNFNGTQQTALGGGLVVLHAKGQDESANLITDADGNFVTNNDFKPQALTIPLYTPTSSNDEAGYEGNITRDDNYMYVKTSTGWKRTNLENF